MQMTVAPRVTTIHHSHHEQWITEEILTPVAENDGTSGDAAAAVGIGIRGSSVPVIHTVLILRKAAYKTTSASH